MPRGKKATKRPYSRKPKAALEQPTQESLNGSITFQRANDGKILRLDGNGIYVFDSIDQVNAHYGDSIATALMFIFKQQPGRVKATIAITVTVKDN